MQMDKIRKLPVVMGFVFFSPSGRKNRISPFIEKSNATTGKRPPNIGLVFHLGKLLLCYNNISALNFSQLSFAALAETQIQMNFGVILFPSYISPL